MSLLRGQSTRPSEPALGSQPDSFLNEVFEPTMAPPRSVAHKRSLPLPLPAFVCSIVGGVVIVFALFIAAVAICRITRGHKHVQQRISGPLAVEHQEARQALRKLNHARQPSMIPAVSDGLTTLPQRRLSSRHSSPVTPKWRISGASTASILPKERHQSFEEPKQPASVLLSVPSSKTGRRKSLDDETASLYSCQSAPLDFHERLFSTPLMMLAPDMPVSAPAWISTMSSQQAALGYTHSALKSPQMHLSAPRYPQSSSTRRAKPASSNESSQAALQPLRPAHTHTSSWSRQADIPPPTRVHWRVPAERRSVSSGGPSQPVADRLMQPSPLPTSPSSVAPLNIRTRTTRNDSGPHFTISSRSP
ncbi:hypothetical protein BC835DRAFT_1412716 [Cytidiella melzeri]|nr:hypothetical protein BC835DRAFT_1412716 [Cytidiella melzeri]